MIITAGETTSRGLRKYDFLEEKRLAARSAFSFFTWKRKGEKREIHFRLLLLVVLLHESRPL